MLYSNIRYPDDSRFSVCFFWKHYWNWNQLISPVFQWLINITSGIRVTLSYCTGVSVTAVVFQYILFLGHWSVGDTRFTTGIPLFIQWLVYNLLYSTGMPLVFSIPMEYHLNPLAFQCQFSIESHLQNRLKYEG